MPRNMTFSGKRYRRTGGSSLDDFFKKASGIPEPDRCKKLMMSNAPIWSYTVLDDHTISMQLQTEEYSVCKTYKLDVENELKRHDGVMVTMTFTLEGDNVLKQSIKQPSGKVALFKREFHERTATMTITLESDPRIAYVFYEMVD